LAWGVVGYDEEFYNLPFVDDGGNGGEKDAVDFVDALVANGLGVDEHVGFFLVVIEDIEDVDVFQAWES
jgi:hypothetical protein